MIPARDLVEAVIRAESGGNPLAVSPAGAQGLMQVMPATARDPGFGIAPLTDPFNPQENRRFGTEYLGKMLQRYGGDTEAALAAYNWGPGNADRWVRGGKDMNALPTETRNYIQRIGGFLQGGAAPQAQPAGQNFADLAARYGVSSLAGGGGVPSLAGSEGADQLRPVTDPEILRQLNAGGAEAPPSGELRPVTDPEILRQLNAEPEQPGMLSRVWEGAKDMVTGASRREFDIPEFEAFEAPASAQAAIAYGLITATDPEQQEQIVRQQLPDAKIERDRFGNTVVEYKGERGYLNRPGLSTRDVMQAVGQGAIYAGALMPAAGLAATTLGRAATTGITAALTSLGLDAASMPVGAENFNVPRAGMTGATAGAFELLAPAMSSLWRMVRRPNVMGAGHNLTPAAKKILLDAGFDPDQVTDDMAREFVRLAREAASPEDAARMAQAQSLPVPVKLTRGDITGSPSQQMTESLARKGGLGERAETVMRGFRDEQQEALRANIPAIQARLSGGRAQVAEMGQGGAQAQRALVDAQSRGAQGVRTAYDAARASSATVPARALPRVEQEIGEAAATFLRHAPRAQAELQRLTQLGRGGGQNTETLVSALFDWRRDISRLAGNSSDATERAALTAMRRQFDRSIRDVVADGLMSGDQQAVNLWKRAIAKRASVGRLFEAGDLVEKLVAKEGNRLKVAPEAASNAIFGAGNLGFMNRPQLAREIKRMKKLLPSDDWNALREEFFVRFAQAGEGAYQGAGRDFSGVGFKKAWDNFMLRNAPLAREMFSEDERKLIGQFASVAAKATGRVAGGDNPSGTALGLSNMVQRLFNFAFFGPKAQAVLAKVLPPAYEVLQGGRVYSATRGALPKAAIPPGAAGALGAVATDELF